MHDLVIRGGTVVDGTGAAPFGADVAIDGDRITAIGPGAGEGRREIDASGAYVTPGFVDVHTHLDAQLAWDPDATSSCWHGVTSVVLGNCGVTFAPVRKGQERWLAELMESVEDIPADSILEGLAWDWETYGEYLAAIDRMPKGVNVGGMIGHCAVRHYAMGERSLDETPATDDDIATMCDLVDEAMAAGALGFSTSRTLLHRVPDGRPVPGTWADERELLAIADVLGRHGTASTRSHRASSVPARTTKARAPRCTGWPRSTGAPVDPSRSGSRRATPDRSCSARSSSSSTRKARGGELRPQTTARGIGLLFGLQHRTFFDRAPAWAALQPLPLDERLAALRDDRRRADLIRAADEGNTPPLDWWGRVRAHPGARRLLRRPGDLARRARRAERGDDRGGVRPHLLETEGRALFNYPFLNQRMDAVEELLDHPRMAIGLGDSGAHVGLIMDASLPTWFLLHWVRDRASTRSKTPCAA